MEMVVKLLLHHIIPKQLTWSPSRPLGRFWLSERGKRNKLHPSRFKAHYRIKVDENVNLTRWESEVIHEELHTSIISWSLKFISSSHAISVTDLISLRV